MERRRRLLIQALRVAMVLLVPQVAWASSFAAGPAVQVSGVSPFAAGCGLAPEDPNDPAASRLYLNSEVEPFVDVNPANGDNITATRSG